MPPLSLSPQIFVIMSALVAEHAGLHFEPTHFEVFAEKVGARAAEAGFTSLLDYYYFLRYDPAGPGELDALVEALVIGETYLFRELQALETMVSELVVPALQRGERPRIWSAACSTGEEPHTVAMLLASRGLLDAVDLVATDVSERALGRARSGRFSRRALRQDIPPFAERWMESDQAGLGVRPRLTQAITWRRVNLVDRAAMAAQGTFDVILCRNVLFYFSDDTTRLVVESLARQLRGPGALFIGVSESLLRFGVSLVCEERNGVFFYRKPA